MINIINKFYSKQITLSRQSIHTAIYIFTKVIQKKEKCNSLDKMLKNEIQKDAKIYLHKKQKSLHGGNGHKNCLRLTLHSSHDTPWHIFCQIVLQKVAKYATKSICDISPRAKNILARTLYYIMRRRTKQPWLKLNN